MEYKKYIQTQTRYTQAQYSHGIRLSGEIGGQIDGEKRQFNGREFNDQRLNGIYEESDSFNYSESVAFDSVVNKNKMCKIAGWASVSNIVDGHNDVITTEALNKAVQAWKDKNSQESDAKQKKISVEKICNIENEVSNYRDVNPIDTNGIDTNGIETNESVKQPIMNHPIMLLEHDLDKPIGIWQKLTVTDKGLFVEGMIFDELPASVLANTLLSSNKIHGLSIGYKPIKFDRKQGVRFITELEICEISIVQIPANPQATITCYTLQ